MSNFTKLNPKIFFAFLLMSLAAASPMSFAQTSAATTQNIKANRAVAQKLLADGMPNEALQRIEQVIIAAPRDLSARFFPFTDSGQPWSRSGSASGSRADGQPGIIRK